MAAHADCRMYENKYPDVDDVVMVQVKSIAEMGAYVALLEYNSIEGMILLSELSRRRIRSITKLIKVGRQEPVMVLRVDKEKGYIDLSKRRVSAEDIAACEDRYSKSKMVHSIMRHVAETTSTDLELLYSTVAWPLSKVYGHSFEAFKNCVTEPEAIFQRLVDGNGGQPIECLTEEVKEALVKNIRRRMTPMPLKIRADVELTCFVYDGVLHIQSAMRSAEAAGTEECPVKMKLVAPPLYVLTTSTLDKAKGMEVLAAACEVAKERIAAEKGRLVVKEAPRVMSAHDDRLLTEQLLSLEKANQEVAGDDSNSDEEEMGMGSADPEAGPQLTVEA